MGVAAKPENDEISTIKNLRTIVKDAANKSKKLIVVFDEIEYISFIAPLDEHWKTEFVDFGRLYGLFKVLTAIFHL